MIWLWWSLFAVWMLSGIAVLIWGRDTAKDGLAYLHAVLHGKPNPLLERVLELPGDPPTMIYTWRCPRGCGWSFISGNNYPGTTADAIAKFEGQLRQLGHELSHILGIQALVDWLDRRF